MVREPALELHFGDEARVPVVPAELAHEFVPDVGLGARRTEPARKNPFGDFLVGATGLDAGDDFLERHIEKSAQLAVQPDRKPIVAMEVGRQAAGLPQADLVEHPAEMVQAGQGLVVRGTKSFDAGHGGSETGAARLAKGFSQNPNHKNPGNPPPAPAGHSTSSRGRVRMRSHPHETLPPACLARCQRLVTVCR